MKLMPRPTRPMIRMAKFGAKAWRRVKPPIPRKVMKATRQGLYLESQRLRGMARNRFPKTTEAPSQPCWTGERSRSSAMSGRRRPMTNMDDRAIATPEVRVPTTIHLPLKLFASC